MTGSDGLPKCSVMNQCLTQAAGIPECNCPQCVCRNMPDNQPPQCSTVPDECAANNGNCWQADIGGKRYTACKNEIDAKRKAALAGQDPSSVRGHSCACPAVRRRGKAAPAPLPRAPSPLLSARVGAERRASSLCPGV